MLAFPDVNNLSRDFLLDTIIPPWETRWRLYILPQYRLEPNTACKAQRKSNLYNICPCTEDIGLIILFITSILKSLVILAISLALSSAIYSQIALFFALNRIFFSANENETVKQNYQSDLKGFFN